jgi:hypothetical protein
MVPALLAVALAGLGAVWSTAASAAGCTDSWKTAVSGDWNTAGDWSNGVPGSGDDVCITVDGTYTVTLDATASVHSVTIGGSTQTPTLLIGSASASASGDLTAGSMTIDTLGAVTLTCNGCAGNNHQTLTVTGTLTNDGTLTTDGDAATRTLFGNITNAGTVQINKPTGYAIGAASSDALDNKGTIAIADGASLGADPSSVTTNDTGGAIDVTGSGEFATSGTFTEGAGTTSGTLPVLIANGGSLGITGSGASAMTLQGTVSLTGDIGSAQTVTIGGGSGHVDADVTASTGFTNNGHLTLTCSGCAGINHQTLTVTSGTLTNSGTITASGDSNQRSLTATVANQGTIQISASAGISALSQSAGSTTVNTAQALAVGPTVTMSGGGFDLPGTGTLTGSIDLTGGSLTGTGTITGDLTNTSGTVAPGDAPGTLTVSGSLDQGPSGELDIPIDGTTAGQFSVLAVGGDATLGGTVALMPSGGYAASASVGDAVPFLTYGGGRSGTFATTTVTPPLGGGKTFMTNNVDAGRLVEAVVAGPPPPPPPSNTVAPSITPTTPGAGTVVTCSPGTWTGSPRFAYQWNLDGTAITGATQQTYTVATGDQGHALTCAVTATNAGGQSAKTSAPVTVSTPPPPPPPPKNTSKPTISGTPLPGHELTCNPGTWTGNPTFTYQWQLGSSPIAGATHQTYTVTILDEGQTITCTVNAGNGAGTTSSTSGVAVVAQKGTLTCPRPSGSLTPSRIGPLALGSSRSAARHALKRFRVTHYGFDDFCLFGGWGIRAGYKAGRTVLLLTANPFYKLKGTSVGLTIASITKRLDVGKVFVIGLNDW